MFLKKMFKDWEFRQQLILVFVVGVIVLAVSTSLVISNVSDEKIKAQIINEGAKLTEFFADQSRIAIYFQSTDNADDAKKAVTSFPNVLSAEIYYPSGLSLWKDKSSLPIKTLPDFSSDGSHTVIQLAESDETWTFLSPVYSENQENDEEMLLYDEEVKAELLGFVTITLSKQALKEFSKELLGRNITVSAVIAFFILIVLVIISNKVTRPLKQLSEIMERADHGEQKLRADVSGPRDISHMQKSFNSMMTILERRELELIRAKDVALESARVKGEFAANVSHELRTPMNAVLGMLDLLKTLGLTSKQLEYVETAKTSGEVLLDLIDDVLNFSKVDAGEMALVKEEVFLEDLLEEVVSLMTNQATSKHINLGCIFASTVPQLVLTDSVRIRQILINLIGNSIKFTDQGEVSIRLEGIANASDGFHLRFEVKDTGIGIVDEAQERIFEAFTQADSSTTRKYGGTGLGLAISKKITELLGGQIGLTSEIGKGSTFWFTVPLLDEDILNTNILPDIPQKFQDFNVLCLNNGDIVEEFVHEAFAQWGIKHTQANDPLKGLELLKDKQENKEPFNLVVFDEDLDGMNGVNFIKMISEEIIDSSTGIIIVMSPWNANKALYPERVLQLYKPLRSGLFFEALRGVVGEQTYAKPSTTEIYRTQIGKRILVVDDNRANQQVAVGMLDRIGCTVRIADTGKSAIDLLVRKPFDLILMDCQMPEMDGYEATKHIRQFEGEKSRIPIIAMTANDSPEEEKRCLDIGMDDFLPKPLRLSLLQQKIDSWLGTITTENTSPCAPEQLSHVADQKVVFDPQILNELRGSVGEVVDSMIEAFLEDTPVYLQSIKNAYAQKDAQQVRELAHTIKGSACNFGALEVIRLSKLLEQLGSSDDIDGASSLISELLEAFEELRKELREVLYKNNVDDSEYGHAEEHTILIADDDRPMRMALTQALVNQNYQIEGVADGANAVAVCERKMPDIILMDALMPKIDGFAACRRIRALPNGEDVPILMITALEDEESIGRAFECGASDYIPKPVHFSVLQQRVARLLQASKTEKHVKKLAYHDPLTGLPNRSMLMQQLRLIVNRAKINDAMVAVLFLDLDRFKVINDSLGHGAGDLLLKAVSDRIRRCLREQDFIARLGGDEFTVVLEGIKSPSVAASIAQKICTSLSKPFVFLQKKMFVTSSIGICLYPKDGEDISDLLKHADSAMFSAKKKGNSYRFYEDGMEDEVAKRLELERELGSAFGNNEMELFYQPQIEASTDDVISAEALIRWNHPRLGLIFPDTFIPIAEQSSLIEKLGDWVMEAACKQIRTWSDQGHTLRLAINISGREFQSGDLSSKLKKMLQKYHIPAKLLELEITESMLLENHERLAEDLNLIRKMGVTVAIDDFGSGYSSLNYLKNLPVDILKIDRVFVENIQSDKSGQAVVRGVIALAKSLEMKTVVEGVEYEDQIQILKDLGCDYLQGYVYSKALPAQQFSDQFVTNITAELAN